MTAPARLTDGEIAEFDAIAAKANDGKLTPAEFDRFQALEAKMAAEVVSDRAAELRKPVTATLHPGATPEDAGLTAAFNHYLRTGKPNDDITQLRAAQGEGTPSAGGYLVPTGFREKLVERLKAFGGVAGLAEEITTDSGNTLPWPTLDDTSNVGEVVAEHGTFSTGADLVFGSASLGAYRYAAGGAGSLPIRISVELLQDSGIDVQALVARKLAERIGRIQATHLVTGTGVAEPKGLVHGLTGVEVATSGALTYDDLINFIHSIDPAYRENASWLFNDVTLAAVRKMKDADNNPLWRPSTADMGTMVGGGSLLGYPVQVDQAFPNVNLASSAVNWGAFGDIRQGYVVRRVRDVVVVVNPWTRASFGEVEFSAWARMDALPQDAHAYVALSGNTA